MFHVSRADVENLNSQNEAELRRQFEEQQQETEHVYELLENKIQLLQEVSRSLPGPLPGVLFYSLTAVLFSGFHFSPLYSVLKLLT